MKALYYAFKKKLHLAKLDKRRWDDMQQAYAIEDEGKYVMVLADFELLSGQIKSQGYAIKGCWLPVWHDEQPRRAYQTSMERAEKFVDDYDLPREYDVVFEDGSKSASSAILNYNIWIDSK